MYSQNCVGSDLSSPRSWRISAMIFGLCRRARPQLRRVGRGQDAEQHEHQRRDDDQQHDAPQQPADDVAGHRLSVGIAGLWSVRGSTGSSAADAMRRGAAPRGRADGPPRSAALRRYFSDVNA